MFILLVLNIVWNLLVILKEPFVLPEKNVISWLGNKMICFLKIRIKMELMLPNYDEYKWINYYLII